jgi:hypothetical protein
LPLHCIIPGITELSRTPGRTFDREYLDIAKPSIANLRCQFLGTVKMGGREVCCVTGWIAVQTVGQICFNDFAKVRILEEAPRKPIDQRSETRDRAREEA